MQNTVPAENNINTGFVTALELPNRDCYRLKTIHNREKQFGVTLRELDYLYATADKFRESRSKTGERERIYFHEDNTSIIHEGHLPPLTYHDKLKEWKSDVVRQVRRENDTNR